MLLKSLLEFDLTTIGIIAQVLSLIGACFSFIAFQGRTHRAIMIFKSCDCIIFATSWFLLGNLMAGIMSVLCLVRNLIFAYLVYKNKTTLPVIIGFSVLTVVLGVGFWSGWTDLFTIIGTVLSSIAFGLKKPNHVRMCNIPVSVLWLVNDSVVTASLGGMITEIFSIVSSVIGLIRFRPKKEPTTIKENFESELDTTEALTESEAKKADNND